MESKPPLAKRRSEEGGEEENRYRATSLWNDVVRHFCRQMPRKKHRFKFRSYEETFTGTEALDFLHAHLSERPEYAEKRVSRSQALALLNKMFDQAIFRLVRREERRRSASASSTPAKEDVRDDGSLYCMTESSPSKLVRTPLALKTRSGLRPLNCDEEAPEPRVQRRHRSAVTPLKYTRLLASPLRPRNACTAPLAVSENSRSPSPKKRLRLRGKSSAGDRVPTAKMPTRSASLNARVEKKEEEQLMDLADFLRHGAGKEEEAEEENKKELRLVARALAEAEVQQLWRHGAMAMLKSVLDSPSLELPDSMREADVAWACSRHTKRGLTEPKSEGDSVPEKLLRPMRFLLNFPWPSGTQTQPNYAQMPRLDDTLKEVLCHLEQRREPILSVEATKFLLEVLSRAESLDAEAWDASGAGPSVAEISAVTSIREGSGSLEAAMADFKETCEAMASSGRRRPALARGLRYETEFATSEPQTRLVGDEFERLSLGSTSTRSSYALSKTSESSPFPQDSSTPSSSPRARVEAFLGTVEHPSPEEIERGLRSLPGLRDSPHVKEAAARASRPPIPRARLPRLRLPPSIPAKVPPSIPSASSLPPPPPIVHRSASADAMNSTSSHSTTSASFLTVGGETKAVQALQLACLFLPIKTRIWLKTILKFMRRAAANPHLVSALGLNRYKCLQLFLAHLIPAGAASLSQRLKLATFLGDNDQRILAPSPLLCEKVKAHIASAEAARPRHVAAKDLRYCDWLPKDEYAAQARAYSQSAMDQLLESLISSDVFSPKSHRKKLEAFRKEHPKAFSMRFPTSASFEALFPPNPRRRLLHRLPLTAKK